MDYFNDVFTTFLGLGISYFLYITYFLELKFLRDLFKTINCS